MMSGSGLLDSGTPFILSSLLTECENPIKGQHDMEQWFPHLDDDLNYLGIFVELKESWALSPAILVSVGLRWFLMMDQIWETLLSCKTC